MQRHLHRELDNIKKDLLFVGSLVKDSVEKAIVAFNESNTELADEVIAQDKKIDAREVEIEEECLKLLALHQPVAEDLRFITAVMKINNALEGMGDSATSISKRCLHYAKRAPIAIPDELSQMSEKTVNMIEQTLKAFFQKDDVLAKEVIKLDDDVDDLQADILSKLKNIMKNDANHISVALDVFTITRRLEGIADLATNICEDIIYMVKGEIVRHQRKEIESE